MYEQEESIYNLIPPEAPPPRERLKYKSVYPPEIPPTYSTLCLRTTSMPGVSNAPGDYQVPCGHHTNKGFTNTFGLPNGMSKADAARFTKKNTGTMKLPPSKFRYSSLEQKFAYTDTVKRAPIPAKDDKPIMGLSSEKNFIVANAVENILAGIK